MALQPIEGFSENEAIIESTFRRLLAAIESERESLRSTAQDLEVVKLSTGDELEQMKSRTEEWCYAQRQTIDSQWRQVQEVTDRMRVTEDGQNDEITVSVSGEIFTFSKRCVMKVEGSLFNMMFSPQHIGNLPKDHAGRYVLDWNPKCFKLIIDHLQYLERQPSAPLPRIPKEEKMNFDILVDTLQIKMFMPINRVNPKHVTSLAVRNNRITVVHRGWQTITAEHPASLARDSYFEILIEENPDPKGGLCLGVIGHIPEGTDVHKINFSDAVMYNSGNHLVGGAIGKEDVGKGMIFPAGSRVGVQYNVRKRALTFYLNKQSFGTCYIKREAWEDLQLVYPCLAMYLPDQRVLVSFGTREEVWAASG
uniref:B30.2/SPRY domain-containing protein n=1 Tax=Oxyrrhis marina TaxID=2969 RepID=A0A7S3XGM9_OXYMA